MIHKIIEDLRLSAQACKASASDHSDEELSEHLREMYVVLTSIESVLEEYDQ